ncbi:MAG: hypothetical protein KatS3mg105_2979 [Gemmatales bacterium]|nr:MAG: hypothetical protein KatS3mg105_2979 [Gemmatales bacterium]
MSSHFQAQNWSLQLTRAVKPAPEKGIDPKEGFRIGVYRDRASGLKVPVLGAAVSAGQLFDVFLSLLDPLGQVVDVVLETSHDSPAGQHRDLRRSGIDLAVLKSYLCEFENLLLDDGCTGIAVVSRERPIEVQFDEHKTLIVYARDLRPFTRILLRHGLSRDDSLRLIFEGQHLHFSEPRYVGDFHQLTLRLGAGVPAEQVSW